ncbi:hypothetical protein EGY20_07100 [Burkholderia multivorans]|nr:hypothetical protein EGY20_07100 [Burkholderia multivorans]
MIAPGVRRFVQTKKTGRPQAARSISSAPADAVMMRAPARVQRAATGRSNARRIFFSSAM